MFGFFKQKRREQRRAAPFPAEWLEIIERNVPLYGRLPEPDRTELQGHIQVFLDEKVFEGCGGLELTDEIRLTIAAQACLLLLHRETDYYKRLITILVYPSAYVAKGVESLGGGVVLEGPQGRLGEAWTDGVVVLSWDSVRSGAADIRDGQNVVLHEFAHQLDQEDGVADGAPILERRSSYVAWARDLGSEYEQLREDKKRNRKTVLDTYGATNPAEFFAVATECFFEKPAQLKKKHPELYEELKEYYRQDPEQLLAGPGTTGQAPNPVAS
jgi:Mlc titration factor MtfA (ptsG expression regulator)